MKPWIIIAPRDMALLTPDALARLFPIFRINGLTVYRERAAEGCTIARGDRIVAFASDAFIACWHTRQ